MRVHCENYATFFDLHGCVRIKCSHRSTCLHKTCHTVSYVVLDRHVSTQCVYYETYSCACSHTKRRVSVHFLTYEVMPMRTPCLSLNFPQVQSEQSKTSQLFNLRTLLTMQILNYKDVSCANCHIGGRVCVQRVTKFLTFYLDHHVSTHCVDYETCSCACSRIKKTYVCTLFELERHGRA